MRRAFFALGACLCFVYPGSLSAVEPAKPPGLTKVKRIYVEQLGGGPSSDQARDMIISALQNAKIFQITDNQERADAVLRGSADDRVFNEEHDSSESLGVRANAGAGSYSNSNSRTGNSARLNVGAGITDNENSRIQERRHEASASLRLVDENGDVIWSTTQESSGGKFRGAMADVADKVARQMADDFHKAQAPPAARRVGTNQTPSNLRGHLPSMRQ